jgi:hypothetical protein
MDHPGPSRERGGLVGWFISHPISAAAVVLLLLLVGIVWLLDAAAETRLQRRLDAIRASGAPLNVEDLNAAMPKIPDDENMAIPILAAAAEMAVVKIPEETNATLPLVGAGQWLLTGQRLSLSQRAAAQWYLEKNAGALAKVHEALKLERGFLKVTWGTPTIQVFLPELRRFGHVLKTLALEATAAANDGDPERAGEIIKAMFRFDRAQQGNKTLIGLIVRIACNALTQEQIERTVNLSGLDDDAMRQIQALLAEKEVSFDIRYAMMTERAMFLDTIKWVLQGAPGDATPGQVIGGKWAPGSWYGLIPVIPALDQANGLDIFTELIEAVNRPGANVIKEAMVAQAKARALPRYCHFSRILIPSLNRAVELWGRTVGSSRALRAGLAGERYRLATGAWPETLDALVPAYLEAVPVDPFDDQPIRHAHIDEGIKVWSIGEDLKDDGGDVKRLERGKNERPTDFGWIFLNQDLRGRPPETGDD